jgi:polyisoprenoid-binding protein YceI
MKKKYLLFVAFTLAVFGAFGFIATQSWEIGTDYSIKFNGKFADGSFKKMSGKIVFDPSDPENSHFDVFVDVRSIDTGKELKNKHAVGDKWLDAEKFPVIHFVSKQITRTDTAFSVSGDLDLHGVKKEITIPFTFHLKDGQGIFQGSFKVDRGAFGIGRSSGKDSDFTTIQVDVPVIAK